MCDIQSSVIHSSTAPPLHQQELTPGSLWDLAASSELAWGGMPNYQGHPLWEAAHHGTVHPAQYQPELFGFGPEFWGGTGKGGVPAHLVPGSRAQLHYAKQCKKRRRIATASQRRAANIRERRRMFNLNEAFDRLRTKVPTFAYEKRLSRIETLRLAITYISFMDELLATPVPGPGGVSCRRGTGQVGGHGQPRGVPHLTPRGEELLSNHINPFAGINGGSAMCQQDLSK